jgi:hypothetical protein
MLVGFNFNQIRLYNVEIKNVQFTSVIPSKTKTQPLPGSEPETPTRTLNHQPHLSTTYTTHACKPALKPHTQHQTCSLSHGSHASLNHSHPTLDEDFSKIKA